jgi:site-specific recombinase XerD
MAVRQSIPPEVSPQGSIVRTPGAHRFTLPAGSDLVESGTMRSGPNHPPLPPWPLPPVRSFARANQELAEAFQGYLQARGFKPSTLVSYGKSVSELLEFLKATSIAAVDRSVIRGLLDSLQRRGLMANTLRRHTDALRAFFRFVRLTGLTPHDPMLMLAHRKLPTRLPRVLTLKEIERLIAAGNSPTETAVAEFFYSTGVRISEIVAMRLDDVDFSAGVARVKKGKGGKDRIVLFGRKADAALRRMIELRPPEAGFLFEARRHTGSIAGVICGAWYGSAYVGAVRKIIRIGAVSDLPTQADARRAFDRILAVTPGYKPRPPRPFTDRAVRLMIARMGMRAGIGKVHPHALRRAFATHMLERGSDLRVVQELLGHERLTTTCIYTTLSAANLKAVHKKCHPKGADDAKS